MTPEHKKRLQDIEERANAVLNWLGPTLHREYIAHCKKDIPWLIERYREADAQLHGKEVKAPPHAVKGA